MATSPLSFDHHLPFAAPAERAPYATHPIQAQICRNGQMKYARTRVTHATSELVMPDGEIIARDVVEESGASAGGSHQPRS